MKYFSMRGTFHKLGMLIIYIGIILLAFLTAVFLRHDCLGGPECPVTTVSLLPALLIIKIASFSAMHLVTGWWRYVSIHDVVDLVKANLVGSLLFAGYVHFIAGPGSGVSAAILILDGLLTFLLMCGARFTVRLLREFLSDIILAGDLHVQQVLIVGSGAVGQTIAREIHQNPHLKWRVNGFLDQEEKRLKQRFQGIPVLATVDQLAAVLDSTPTDIVIFANQALRGKELRGLVDICQAAGVRTKILPNVSKILRGEVVIEQVRDVRLEDLLGRKAVRLENDKIRICLQGKRVLVTGAAGSIGREICRQVAGFGARSIILLDSAETPLFQVDRELKVKFPGVEFVPRLNDVRDPGQIDFVLAMFRPEVIFHAAAYKHVPMAEDNPLATLENNIVGTRVLVDSADRYRVERMVMVSTDKAVNPTNIMGASKRVAEQYVQAMALDSGVKFITVRFGNVLGSNGSVVPIFQEQIRMGGPVTVTDPQATRFFMTIPEAVQLVLQAESMGEGGEIFILEMGEQVRIVKLAEDLIRLSGLVPYRDIDITFTGLRPGEKLHEELLHQNEGILPTSHAKIRVARSASHDLNILRPLVNEIAFACRQMDRERALEILAEIVPEYCPDLQKFYAPPAIRSRPRPADFGMPGRLVEMT